VPAVSSAFESLAKPDESCPNGRATKGEAMRSSVFLVLMVGLVLVAAAAPAGAEGWQQLGQTIVDFRANPDAITAVGNAGPMARLKLQAKDASIEILNVKVYLADGQTFDVALKKYLRAGGETKEIEVAGGPKEVQKVEFNYAKGSDGSRMPTVRLLASK
jgi:hypothetical protein